MKPHEVTQPGRYGYHYRSPVNERRGECVVERDYGNGRLRLKDGGLWLDEFAAKFPEAEAEMWPIDEVPA